MTLVFDKEQISKLQVKEVDVMPSIRPRLFIFDQSLRDVQGHHFTLTRNVTLSAQKEGYSVYWICSTGFKLTQDMNVSGIEVRPTLKNSMYDSYKSGAPEVKNPEKLMVEALLTACESDNITENDRLLFHTADGLTYLAVAELMKVLKPSKCPVIHICTPYDPVGVMPNRRDAGEIADAISELNKLGWVDKKIFFYGENDLLSAHLSKLWNVKVRPLNLPAANFSHVSSKTSTIQFRREKLGIGPEVFLCTYLGSARLEKGYHQLPYVVSRTFEFAGKGEFQDVNPSKIHFAFQSSPQIIGYHQTIKNAMAKMLQRPKSQVTLLTDVMSNEDYSKLLFASDMVILPYEVDKYRVRGSGVVTEVLSAGKILAATSGTYPGHIAENSGGVTADTPLNFAKSILKVIQNKTRYREMARKSAVAYSSENHYEYYWTRCLAVETLGVSQ